jgi:3-hydroxymyristoyl/3-hydroxydecanoyl-(acyl carrier protein) dehydratase
MTVALPLSIESDHPAFAGHFPGRPVVPGVMLLDLCLRSILARDGNAVRWSIDNAKFLSPVAPGDALMLSFDESTNTRGRLALRVTARTGDAERVAMTASLSHPKAD